MTGELNKVTCSWCKREVGESDAREVTLLGRKVILCEDDFQLIWRGLGGINALCTHLKAAWAARK